VLSAVLARVGRLVRGRWLVLVRCLLLHKIERARAAYDAEALVPSACALCISKLGLDVVAIILALVGEDSTGILPGGNYAIGRQLGGAVLSNLPFDQQVAGFPRRATLPVIIAVLYDAWKLSGVALSVPFCGAGELRKPISVEALL